MSVYSLFILQSHVLLNMPKFNKVISVLVKQKSHTGFSHPCNQKSSHPIHMSCLHHQSTCGIKRGGNEFWLLTKSLFSQLKLYNRSQMCAFHHSTPSNICVCAVWQLTPRPNNNKERLAGKACDMIGTKSTSKCIWVQSK